MSMLMFKKWQCSITIDAIHVSCHGEVGEREREREREREI